MVARIRKWWARRRERRIAAKVRRRQPVVDATMMRAARDAEVENYKRGHRGPHGER